MTRIPARLRNLVRERAQMRCEYCQLPEFASPIPFHAEHIIAVQHDGPTELTNLAWACFRCNTYKGPNVASFDPETGVLTALYHPRQQTWAEHFEIQNGQILGKTPEGRVTAKLLQFNIDELIDLRIDLIESGEW